MLTRTVSLVAVLLISTAGLVEGQRPNHPEGSPAAVADSFLTRLARKDFDGAAEYVDAGSLDEFRRAQIASMRSADSIQKSPRAFRDVPPAVAEYFEAQARRADSTHGSRIWQEFGVKSVDEVEAMNPREVFARWLESQHPETQIARAMQAAGRDSLRPQLMAVIGTVQNPVVLGAVTHGDSAAYALFKNSMPSAYVSPPDVLPLRLTRAGWRLHAEEAAAAIRGGMCSFGFAIMDVEEP